MKQLLLFIITILLSNAYSQNAGNTGLSFLKFGFGARNISIGDLGSVTSEDLTALHYNPANLNKNTDNEVMVGHNSWIQDISSQVLGVKTMIFEIPIAIGFNITNISDIEIRTRPGEPQAKFNANYFYGSISSAYNLLNELSVGATIKYLYEGILDNQATGLGFDFGFNYLLPNENVSVSAVVRNIGSMKELRKQSTKLPSDFRIGTQYKINIKDYYLDLLFAGEYQKYLDADSHLNFGFEILYNKLLALRAGYQTNYEIRDFTAGFGLCWGNLRFDYAFIPFQSSFGSGNIFSLAFRF